MSFDTGYLSDPARVGAGERFTSKSDFVLSATTFEDGLIAGRFAKLDSGSIDNIDGSATPVIAGVPLRLASMPVEGDGIYNSLNLDPALYGQIQYLRKGAITVSVVDGDTPTKFGQVYVSNAGDADDGKATTTNDASTVEATGFEFIMEIKPGVWLVHGS